MQISRAAVTAAIIAGLFGLAPGVVITIIAAGMVGGGAYILLTNSQIEHAFRHAETAQKTHQSWANRRAWQNMYGNNNVRMKQIPRR